MEPPIMERANVPSQQSPKPQSQLQALPQPQQQPSQPQRPSHPSPVISHPHPHPQPHPEPHPRPLSTVPNSQPSQSNTANGTVNGLGNGGPGPGPGKATRTPVAATAAGAGNASGSPSVPNPVAVSRPSPGVMQVQTRPLPTQASPSPTMHTPVTARSSPAIQQQHQFRQYQPQQHQPQQRHSLGSQGKVPIIEPPGTYSRQPRPQPPPNRGHAAHNSGFPSPNQEHIHADVKFFDDTSRLTYAIQQSIPNAVRRVVRDNWEKCLLGSEFHLAFTLNAGIHHANGPILSRAIKEFGAKMVSESKHEIMNHFKSNDLDDVADLILSRCSNHFLDKALEKRLKTIDARSLINALARAERLGYENGDVLDEQRGRAQPPAPTAPAADMDQHYNGDHARSTQQWPGSQAPSGNRHPESLPLQCRMCWRKFTSTSPYEYHVQKQVCMKPPPNEKGFPFSCPHCGSGFITKVGQQYHIANRVCGEHGVAPATPKAYAPEGTARLYAEHSSPRPAMPSGPPASSPYDSPSSQQPRTPRMVSSKDMDPYAHLNASTKARLEEDLRLNTESYAPRFKEAEEIQDPVKKKEKLDGLHNSFSTKQSIIRKRYGVRLRMRRTKAEIAEERERLGLKHTPPSVADDPPNAKRQRTDGGPSEADATPQDTPSKLLTVSDMSAGLAGSSATAALSDPTTTAQDNAPEINAPEANAPQNSLSSYQRKGYRVSSSHVPQRSAASSATPAQSPSDHRRGSASMPVSLDDDDGDSSDGDSDSDEEIPASLPVGGRKTGGELSKSFTG